MRELDPNTVLYKEFLDKVKDYYYSDFKENPDFTGDFEKDSFRDSFGRELKKYLEKETKINNPLNHRTILNIINTGLARNVREGTLDILSRFVGHENYSEFVNDLTSRKSKNIRWMIYLLPFLILGGLLYYKVNNDFEKEIYDLIGSANKAQFEAYKSLPKVNSKELRKYYTLDGSALNVVENIIKRSAQLNRVVNLPEDNPSYYSMHDLKIINKKRDRILVETTEHWYLRWYSLEVNDYIKKYDVTNTQIYSIIKENGVWKIDDNDYMGTAQAIEPSKN